MRIYLLRHGIAEVASAGTSDARRALTGEGRKKLRAVLRMARQADVRPAAILTSPLVRAVETAEIAAEVLGVSAKLERTSALGPGGSLEEVWGEIRARKEAGEILLAGHEPQFSQLCAFLLDCPALTVDFKKGALVAIEEARLGPTPGGALLWMLTPKLAAALN